jgi:DNA polymerase III epsilon subunit-like protein
MVDIESLGTEPGAVILSIGAVVFDAGGVDEDGGFYAEVDSVSCQDAGLTIDADTLDWWLGEDEEAKTVLTGGDPLADVLSEFASWFTRQDADEVWANSPSFDCRLLGAAFDAVDVDVPWEYWNERDFRTLSDLPGAASDVSIDDADAVDHDAFDDAVVQARVASKVLDSLRE